MAESKFSGPVAILLTALIVASIQHGKPGVGSVSAELIQLNAILPKLEALHDEAQALLIKNAELKSKILVGLQAQNEAKIKSVKSSRLLISSNSSTAISSNTSSTDQAPGNKIAQSVQGQTQQQQPAVSITLKQKVNSGDPSNKSMIDFSELEDFNRWVEINLEYAFKNTQASAEALKEEASHNNGTVDYSVQAINDGIEGVKYWSSAVKFQDKTLKNEKFDSIE